MSNLTGRHVVVLRDFSYAERPGEEELAIDRFLAAAPEDVTIEIRPPMDIGLERGPHVVISFGIKRYPNETFEWLLAHPRHIHVSQDWWEPTQPQSEWRNKIVEQAAFVVYTSLMHQRRYERIHQVKPQRSRVVPFPMLESDWKDVLQTKNDESATLWCAPWHPDYGNDLMLRWAAREKKNLHAYGLTVPTGQITPSVEGYGPIDLDTAASVFNRYSRFVFFPRVPVPFGFPLLLAIQLGLEVQHSGEIGCLGFLGPWDWLPEHCNQAPKEFWQVVEGVVA